MDVPDSGDQFLPEEQDPVGDVVSQSFKEQVLRELQKMKATQRLEFEALERLQREKHEAERKARHLELELQEQRRKLSLNEEQLTRTFVAAGNVEKQREIILHEDSGSGSADDFGTNDDGDMATEADEAEQNRKERILKRSQKTLQEAALPPRMEVASKNGGTFEGGNGTSKTSVKQKKKLRIAAEEAERWRKHRPKPVPNFDHLHAQLEASAKKRKEFVRRGQVEEDDDAGTTSKDKGSEFFVSRAAELADLRERKEARKQRLLAKQEAIRQKKKQAQDKLIARTRASVGADVMPQRKPTKSETLRVQKLMADAAKKQQERDREEREADARERRREEATRRVRAQVRQSENIRRDNFAGNFVDLKDLDTLAKDKAREQRQQFKEAIARNREKLLAAAALRPSLMERFTTTVKRETHHRAALEAVVKTVFEKDLSALKGILTDDEQELAVEMVAADNENNGNSADAD
ncbi:hypothetical protein PHYBOEH_008932 [Phytophthora boehmeriae]|uniref:Uncharacterized protein n=1 Tax=Phytophthora boehmeriae TaxID=109152 RepID=A0A8T1X4V5_9STRA|nr:hypothetical protein PHYBOEH_008932 [Phytophthora boehmeriae]